jgi:hypothetical protein
MHRTRTHCKPETELFTASIDKIDKAISDLHKRSRLSSLSNTLRPALLSILAILRSTRYDLSDDKRDLDASILLSTHAILLPSILSTVIKDMPNLITTFYHLTSAYLRRSLDTPWPDDIEYCVRHLRYLRGQSLKAFGVPRDEVTTLLVQALTSQLHSKFGNATQGIEEVSALCHELLASGLSETKLIIPMERFAGVVMAKTLESWHQPSQQVMECLHEANTHLPDSHAISDALSITHVTRFFATKSIHDYEVAMAVLDQFIASYPPADTPSHYVRQALEFAAVLALSRCLLYGNPEYLEEAISRSRTHLSVLSPEDPKRGPAMHTLVELESRRFGESGIKKGLPDLDSDDPKVIDLPSFSQLAASLSQ